jgi:hypothetical protein
MVCRASAGGGASTVGVGVGVGNKLRSGPCDRWERPFRCVARELGQPRLGKPRKEQPQNTSGRSPDDVVVPYPRFGRKRPPTVREAGSRADVFNEVIDWYLQNACDLGGVGHESRTRPNPTDDRMDDISADKRRHRVELSEYLDRAGLDAEFLVGFSEGRIDRRLVVTVDRAAWKGDLTFVARKCLRAHGEDEAWSAAVDEGDEYGGIAHVVEL